MAGGRPVEYTDKHLELAKEYLKSCKDTYNDKDKLKVKLPSIEGLARHFQREEIPVHRSTIYEWKETYPEFSDILEAILSEQAERLINSSISGEYNSNIAKLLMGKHGYTDKSEVDQKTTLNLVGEVLNDIGLTRPDLTNDRKGTD